MPGFNKSRFVGLHQVDDDLLCGICLAVFNDPKVTQCCQQTYCGDCIKQWLTTNTTCPNDRKTLTRDGLLEPQRLIKIMINKLEISCDFVENGCQQNVALGQLTEHLENCKYNPEVKCAVCNGKNGDISLHNCIEILLLKNTELDECNREIKESVVKLSKDLEYYKDISHGLKRKNAKLLNENQILLSRNEEMKSDLEKVNENYVKLSKQLNDELNDRKANQTELTEEIGRLKRDKRVMEEKLESLNQIIAKISKHSDQLKTEMSLFDKNKKGKSSETNNDNKRKTSSISASFQFQVENISKLCDFDSVFQHPPISDNDFEWRLIAEHHIDEDNDDKSEYLGVYLGCDNGSITDWSYDASVELKIISATHGIDDYCVTFEHKFCHAESLYGFSDFMRWLDVFNDGFAVNDSITLEVVISAITANSINAETV